MTTAATSAALTRPAPPAAYALILALLAVPGVTIAWALPGGGLWIGVPLAVAAIVVAGRVRSSSFVARQRSLARGAQVLAVAALAWIPICVAFVD